MKDEKARTHTNPSACIEPMDHVLWSPSDSVVSSKSDMALQRQLADRFEKTRFQSLAKFSEEMNTQTFLIRSDAEHN